MNTPTGSLAGLISTAATLGWAPLNSSVNFSSQFVEPCDVFKLTLSPVFSWGRLTAKVKERVSICPALVSTILQHQTARFSLDRRGAGFVWIAQSDRHVVKTFGRRNRKAKRRSCHQTIAPGRIGSCVAENRDLCVVLETEAGFGAVKSVALTAR